jgi:phosphoglycolate phosphatase
MRHLRENGVKTGVVSNRKFARAAVEQSGIASLFDVIIGLEDVRNAKPDPEPVLAALDRLSASAGDAFYVGDTAIDMRTAVAAGVTGIGVATGNYGEDELISSGASASCPNLSRVAETILRYIVKS